MPLLLKEVISSDVVLVVIVMVVVAVDNCTGYIPTAVNIEVWNTIPNAKTNNDYCISCIGSLLAFIITSIVENESIY